MIFYFIPVPLAGSFQFAAVAQGSSLSSLLFLTYSPASTTSSPARNGYVSFLKSFADVRPTGKGIAVTRKDGASKSFWRVRGRLRVDGGWNQHQKTKKAACPILSLFGDCDPLPPWVTHWPFKKSPFSRPFLLWWLLNFYTARRYSNVFNKAKNKPCSVNAPWPSYPHASPRRRLKVLKGSSHQIKAGGGLLIKQGVVFKKSPPPFLY